VDWNFVEMKTIPGKKKVDLAVQELILMWTTFRLAMHSIFGTAAQS
jgi:hypothetical protein